MSNLVSSVPFFVLGNKNLNNRCPRDILGDRWAKTQVLPVTCGQWEESQLGPDHEESP